MCYRPIHLKTGSIVPCSRCAVCIARKISGWSFRLLQEQNVSSSSNFITLTYDTKYVPILSTGQMGLCKRDLQLFFKRLRKRSTSKQLPMGKCNNQIGKNRKISYYAVGEYGGRTQRPHYHVNLFNADIELIQKSWELGDIHIGQQGVCGASIGYSLKYMMKHKKSGPGKSPGDTRQREFALMSKGLGISYLNEKMANWHSKDLVNRVYCTVPGGVKISMPRYYKDKLYYEQEKADIREAYETISHEKAIIKMDTQTTKQFINEQKAIDASFDRMYYKSLKLKL